MMRKTLRARVDEEDDEREDAKEDDEEEEEENEDEGQRASSFTSYFKATNVNVNRILQACKPDNKKAPMCEEDASSAVAREGKASTQKKSARTARKASLREESRARRVMFFSGRTAGSREGASMSAASMSAASMSAASSSWACVRARRSARHASARIAQFAKPRRVPRHGNERFR